MIQDLDTSLNNLLEFVKIKTPETWLDHAKENLDLILIDHAHCERKAALQALNFMSRYPLRSDLLEIMSPLAREELLHFEKVLAILKARKIKFIALTPSEYGATLHANASKKGDLGRLQDELIIGAIIEARSCERFLALSQVIEDKALIKFYRALLKAEARHFEDYLTLAKKLGPCDEKIERFISIENNLITTPCPVFRFHSGPPIA